MLKSFIEGQLRNRGLVVVPAEELDGIKDDLDHSQQQLLAVLNSLAALQNEIGETAPPSLPPVPEPTQLDLPDGIHLGFGSYRYVLMKIEDREKLDAMSSVAVERFLVAQEEYGRLVKTIHDRRAGRVDTGLPHTSTKPALQRRISQH